MSKMVPVKHTNPLFTKAKNCMSKDLNPGPFTPIKRDVSPVN